MMHTMIAKVSTFNQNSNHVDVGIYIDNHDKISYIIVTSKKLYMNNLKQVTRYKLT